MIIGVSSCVESSARKWFLTACYFYRCHCVYVGTLSSWWSRLIIRVNSVATNHSWTELTKTTDLSCIIRRSSFYCPLGILEKVLVCTVSGTMMLVPASLAVPSLILICVCVCSYIGRCILLWVIMQLSFFSIIHYLHMWLGVTCDLEESVSGEKRGLGLACLLFSTFWHLNTVVYTRL